jgi:hypothetical protein
MKQDEIIEMVRIAENKVIANSNLDWKIEFAKLVAAKEREACAETCLQVVASQEMKKFMGDAAHYAACTAAIRARGET